LSSGAIVFPSEKWELNARTLDAGCNSAKQTSKLSVAKVLFSGFKLGCNRSVSVSSSQPHGAMNRRFPIQHTTMLNCNGNVKLRFLNRVFKF
jgi:hypothetical protein